MAKMGPKQKIDYAKIKLDELQQIREQYLKNGGNKQDFRENVDKMIKFYQQLIDANHEKLKPGYESEVSTRQDLNDSRCSTPILKLRDIEGSRAVTDKNGKEKEKVKESKVSQVSKKGSRALHGPVQSAPSIVHPQIIMMPTPVAPQANTSNEGLRLLEKMMEFKSEEHKKLM